MTDKQPEGLAFAGALANELDQQAAFHESQPEYSSAWVQAIRCRNAAALLRTQHAAIERKDALLRQALETLCCETSENMDDPGHRCGHCDDYVDRNGTLRAAIIKELSQ